MDATFECLSTAEGIAKFQSWGSYYSHARLCEYLVACRHKAWQLQGLRCILLWCRPNLAKSLHCWRCWRIVNWSEVGCWIAGLDFWPCWWNHCWLGVGRLSFCWYRSFSHFLSYSFCDNLGSSGDLELAASAYSSCCKWARCVQYCASS